MQHPEVTIELEKQIRNIALSGQAPGEGKEADE
jgi:hypothetical protein